MSSNTRAKMVAGAADLMSRRGVNATSMRDVVHPEVSLPAPARLTARSAAPQARPISLMNPLMTCGTPADS